MSDFIERTEEFDEMAIQAMQDMGLPEDEAEVMLEDLTMQL